MKHLDRDTNQRTMTEGHAMVHTAISLRHNLSDLFCLLDEVNTHLSVFYTENSYNEWKMPFTASQRPLQKQLGDE